MNEFVFLENHSVYSLCEGTIFVSELAEFASKTGFSYLSLCDTNGFYGIMRFFDACRENRLMPLVAVRIEDRPFSGILVARNMRGYAKLCAYVTAALAGGGTVKKRILRSKSDDYRVITRDREVLLSKRAGVFAEINVLKEDYGEDYRFAKKHGIDPVLIHPVYFLKEEDYRIHRLLCAIYHNKKLDSLLPDEVQSGRAFVRAPGEIVRQYGFMADAVRNTVRIASECTFDFQAGTPVFPVYDEDGFGRLKDLCKKNLTLRYDRVTDEIKERLARELSIIRKKGFSDYFLVVHDLVKRSPYTCGRGSAASSLVSYLLFITHVDPIRHNLFFERFMNESRSDPPDIDVDFPWDTRDRVLDYIFTRYPQKSAMVSNHITFSVRSAVRETAKVYGVPSGEIGRVTGGIGHYYNRETDTYEHCMKDPYDTPLFRKVYGDAVRIHSMPRYLSVHCGGVVITPKPIYYYIPVQRAPKGVWVIQLEKDQAEEFGFVKIDILGNRSLAVVRDTLELVRRHYGRRIRYADLNPLDDPATISMLRRGDTIGVFYVESPAMRQLQKKTGKGDYEHLVIHSSIIRPAANPYIREYIERLHGKPFEPIVPEMEDVLKETYGIMCYQEDITKIAMKVAGFSLADASDLRRVISKKNGEKRKRELKTRFFENLLARGVTEKKSKEIWDMIESFSGYSFCKPHSASYALLSFKACYLKAYYPAEFMGAVLKNRGGYYSPLAYISEARRMGIEVRLPDINRSRREYFGKEDTIYTGFMQIKNLTEEATSRLLRERDGRGPFSGLLDFMQRVSPSLSDTVLLVKAGCFRTVERHNLPQLLYKARVYCGARSRYEDEPLYGRTPADERISPPPMRDIPYRQKMKNEIEVFGFIVSVHPMSYYRTALRMEDTVFARDLGGLVGRRVRVAGIMITAKTVRTRDERLMQFISFEDETAIYETVFFPQQYKRFARVLSSHGPYVLTGKVTEEFGVISLNVSSIRAFPAGDGVCETIYCAGGM
jgi:DNA-directed DNA polymerase III PolC